MCFDFRLASSSVSDDLLRSARASGCERACAETEPKNPSDRESGSFSQYSFFPRKERVLAQRSVRILMGWNTSSDGRMISAPTNNTFTRWKSRPSRFYEFLCERSGRRRLREHIRPPYEKTAGAAYPRQRPLYGSFFIPEKRIATPTRRARNILTRDLRATFKA